MDELIRLLVALDPDDATVLPLLEGLIRAGYAVSVARDRRRALEKFRVAPPHLLITDDGEERGLPLLQALQALAPGLPAILLTRADPGGPATLRETAPPACTLAPRGIPLAELRTLVESIRRRGARRW